MVGAVAGSFSAVALGYHQSDVIVASTATTRRCWAYCSCCCWAFRHYRSRRLLGSVITTVLQVRLMAAMRQRNWLPAFTLPFILFGWLALALVGALDLVVPARLDAALQLDGPGLHFVVASGIGQVIFLGQPLAGLLLLVAVGLADRRGAAWMLCGSVAGVAMGLATRAAEQQVLAGVTGYKPALAALAVSRVQRSLLAPVLANIAAVLLMLVFNRLGLPPLTMPFILACWLVALGAR